MDQLGRILLVEDDPNDVELTLMALTEDHVVNEVVVVHDGGEALDYLYHRGAYKTREVGNPPVVLLDLKLPKVDGLDILKRIKTGPDLRTVPVGMCTSSREEQDLVRSYDLGTNAYVVKSVNFESFVRSSRKLGSSGPSLTSLRLESNKRGRRSHTWPLSRA